MSAFAAMLLLLIGYGYEVDFPESQNHVVAESVVDRREGNAID